MLAYRNNLPSVLSKFSQKWLDINRRWPIGDSETVHLCAVAGEASVSSGRETSCCRLDTGMVCHRCESCGVDEGCSGRRTSCHTRHMCTASHLFTHARWHYQSYLCTGCQHFQILIIRVHDFHASE